MLSRLKEYKEFIAILLFFLGGFFWIDSRFPKKVDLESQVASVQSSVSAQVKVLKCLLEQYMLLTQLQLNAQETEKRVRGLKSDLVDIHAMTAEAQPATLTPAMQIERRILEAKFNKEQQAFDKIVRRINEVRGELERQSCGAVSS